jgi:phosphoribosylanthranilate isomerase
MMPGHVVKICGITTLDDAVAAMEAGATAIGFNFWLNSPRYLDPAAAAEIIGSLAAETACPTRVGVFVDASPEYVDDIANRAGLDVAQIHGGACAGLRCWRAYRVGDDGIIAVNDPGQAEAILLDTAVPGLRGGTGRSFAWCAARELQHRVIIAGGLDASNVREAIRQARPWGVDACSRIEAAPGRKDHEKMKAFIAEALAEFA